MVEPTETESIETLDAFADTMLELAAQAERDPSPLREAPVTAPVRRLDEARAARKLVARWHCSRQRTESGRAAEACGVPGKWCAQRDGPPDALGGVTNAPGGPFGLPVRASSRRDQVPPERSGSRVPASARMPSAGNRR